MRDLKIFIGWDPREIEAYEVLKYSIERHASEKLQIYPLRLKALQTLGLFTRDPREGTTEFSMTRFLVPYLCNYQGTSIFIDCDMLVKTDILELLPYLGTFHDVAVCQHDYVPKTEIKATGIQTNYPKKNWSSLMVFNNEKCKILTPDYVNSGHPSTLHRFNWAKDIGRIPLEYNWLVGEYDHNDNAKILHYTLGTPCFPEYANCDHSEEWHFEKEILGI